MEKRSLTWKYFSICETDESKAQCSICKTIISRGGSNTKSYSTSALNNHLKNKHPDEYESIINVLCLNYSNSDRIRPNTDARYSVFGRIVKLAYSVQP